MSIDQYRIREKLADAAMAYCARHEEIASITAQNLAAPRCLALERGTDQTTFECHERLMYPGTYEEEPHPRLWWDYKDRYPDERPERDALLCPSCLARVHLWERRRNLRRGIGGLKKAMLAAYRRLA